MIFGWISDSRYLEDLKDADDEAAEAAAKKKRNFDSGPVPDAGRIKSIRDMEKASLMRQAAVGASVIKSKVGDQAVNDIEDHGPRVDHQVQSTPGVVGGRRGGRVVNVVVLLVGLVGV